MKEPILYEFYRLLQDEKEGITPGLEEYYLVFRLMESKEFPIESFEKLVFVMETMWIKTLPQRIKFRLMVKERKESLQALLDSVHQEFNKIKEIEEAIIGTGDKSTVKTEMAKDTGSEQMNIAGKTETAKIIKTENEIIEETGSLNEFGENRFALAKATARKEVDAKIPFIFTQDYFPVANRQLQQAWRRLKNSQESEDKLEIDYLKTISQITNKGYLDKFHYEKNEVNQLRLFVFVDQSETMAAMGEFGKELVESANQSELHKDIKPWYFYRIPRYHSKLNDYMFSTEDGKQRKNLRRLFEDCHRKDIVVMIYSDGGALNNETDPQIVDDMKEFIEQLQRMCGYIAWVNPAPRSRWTDTNAEYISEFVPMFDTQRSDVENAVSALRGKSGIKTRISYASL